MFSSMKVSSRIWNEINMAKEYTSSIAKYTNRQRQTNQWVDILVITVSIVSVAFYNMQSWSPIVGVLVWLVWKYATNVNFSYHYDFGSSFLMVAVIAVIVSYSFWV